MSIDDEDSFYENLIQRRAVRLSAGKIEAGEGRGLVILETDGLSYDRIQKAIADGNMPTLKQMIDEEGYKVSCIRLRYTTHHPSMSGGHPPGQQHQYPSLSLAG